MARKDGSIQLVDFEYAAPGQPLMDLAVLAMGCSLTDEAGAAMTRRTRLEAGRLLSAYLKRVAAAEELRSFQALRILAALRETFWGRSERSRALWILLTRCHCRAKSEQRPKQLGLE